jgi:hypothetical protein
MNSERSRPGLSRTHVVALLAMLLLGVLSCAIGSRSGVKPQQWWHARGPVVPHDTFPADCSLCHTSDGWRTVRKDFSYDHEKETGVKLEGAHADAECLRCHNDRGPVAGFAARGCAGCHEDPHHAQLGADCVTCHDQINWRPNEQIAKHGRTRFPLVGAHAATACWRCHPGAQVGNFMRADVNCIACHTADLARATNPDHAANGWVDSCDRCHIPTSWTGAGFNHSAWALTGKHKSTSCNQCHVGNVYSGTSTQCVDCHLADYQGAQNPDHVAGGFSTSCQTCHTTSGWQGANFNHSLWPLTGKHKTTACAACHIGGVYQGTPTQCVDCHLADYNATTNPPHAANNIQTTCQDCHNTSGWPGAAFNHTGITNNCVTCHLNDYNATTNPVHSSAGFPQTCETCHTSTTNWHQAHFNHAFPITSGHHHLSCDKCHLDTSNYLNFTCTACHEHSQSNTASHHNGVNGYVWNSQACYTCHPTGHAD